MNKERFYLVQCVFIMIVVALFAGTRGLKLWLVFYFRIVIFFNLKKKSSCARDIF